MRLDYGKVRILLTGDINAAAQRHLLDNHVDASEFKADVLKACHHGAEDIDSEFTKAVAARVMRGFLGRQRGLLASPGRVRSAATPTTAAGPS